jgi:hypothetical protein
MPARWIILFSVLARETLFDQPLLPEAVVSDGCGMLGDQVSVEPGYALGGSRTRTATSRLRLAAESCACRA